MQEAVKSQWSTRQLERQINSFFYERLLSSKNKEQVSAEIQTLEIGKKPEDVIHAKGFAIGIYTIDYENEFISLTDIAKYKSNAPNDVIKNIVFNFPMPLHGWGL